MKTNHDVLAAMYSSLHNFTQNFDQPDNELCDKSIFLKVTFMNRSLFLIAKGNHVDMILCIPSVIFVASLFSPLEVKHDDFSE